MEAIDFISPVLAELGLELPGEINRNRAIMPNCLNRLPTAGRRNAANYAAAFTKQAILRSGKPRALWPALQSYAHFTSPIRRYPDLSLHRAIKYPLAKEQGNKGNTTETGGYHSLMEEMASSVSTVRWRKRRADEATRDVPTG